MRQLAEDDDEAYKRQFSQYIKLGISADAVEGIYKKAHETIRQNPARKTVQKKTGIKKRWTIKKLTLEQRKARVAQKKADFLKKLESGEVE